MLQIFKPFIAIFCVFMLVIAIFNGVSFIGDMAECKRYREDGGMAEAEVIKTNNYTITERSTGRSGGRRHSTSREVDVSDFTVSYTVGGTEYTHDFYQEYGTYNDGQVIPLYYLNENPGANVRLSLERSITGNIVITVILLIIGIGGLILLFKKPRQKVSSEEFIH